MRIANTGPYVMVKKYGIEGLLTVDAAHKDIVRIESYPEREEAKIVFTDGSAEDMTLKVFDNIDVEIRAEMVEYRRTVQLVLKL